jgi:hypothetical protein
MIMQNTCGISAANFRFEKYHLVQVKLMTGVGLLVGQANFQLIALCKTV